MQRYLHHLCLHLDCNYCILFTCTYTYVIYTHSLTYSIDSTVSTVNLHVQISNGGTVTVYYANQWLPVCEEDWNRSYGRVICHQNGYTTYLNSYFSPAVSTGNRLRGINCNGLESNLTYCNTSGINVASLTCRTIHIECAGK